MKRITIAPLVVILALASSARAQDRTFPYTTGDRDLLMLPASLVLSQWGTKEAEKPRDPLSRAEIRSFKRSDVNRLDRSATGNWSDVWGDRSDGYREVVALATIGICGYESLNHTLDDAATLGIIFLEAALLVKGSTYLLKGLVERKRPFVYNTKLSIEDRYWMAYSEDNDVFHSFVSGHATTAFALATFTSTVFTDIHGTSTWSRLLWGSTLTFATLTAYARVKAGEHYPTDVIVGAIVGGAIGHLVPVLHRRGRSDRVALEVYPNGVCLRLQIETR